MSLITVDFKVSTDVGNSIFELGQREKLNDAEVCVRCIGLGIELMKCFSNDENIYQEDLPLWLPKPVQLHDAVDVRRINIGPKYLEDWDAICSQYHIDRYSALAWSLACHNIIEEAIVTDRLFARGPGVCQQIDLTWLAPKKS